MRLSFRSVRTEDLAPCFEYLGEPFVFYRDIRSRVPSLLRAWLASDQMVAHVIEDTTQLCRPKPVGFSVVVFLSETFADVLRAGETPFARAELARRELAGESLTLRPEQVRLANQGAGVSAFYFNQGLTNPDLDDESLHHVHARWGDTFLELRGFKLKEIFCEVHSQKVADWGYSCGMNPRRTWRQICLEPGAKPIDVFQVGTCNTETDTRKGTTASYLFNETLPRFDFTCRQQELLKRAMNGSTDNELATELSISVPAVKKRWVAIYEQVSLREPGWLEDRDPNPLNGESRGAEKRRRLLNYLRQHPEELHPANARAV